MSNRVAVRAKRHGVVDRIDFSRTLAVTERDQVVNLHQTLRCITVDVFQGNATGLAPSAVIQKAISSNPWIPLYSVDEHHTSPTFIEEPSSGRR